MTREAEPVNKATIGRFFETLASDKVSATGSTILGIIQLLEVSNFAIGVASSGRISNINDITSLAIMNLFAISLFTANTIKNRINYKQIQKFDSAIKDAIKSAVVGKEDLDLSPLAKKKFEELKRDLTLSE